MQKAQRCGLLSSHHVFLQIETTFPSSNSGNLVSPRLGSYSTSSECLVDFDLMLYFITMSAVKV